MIYRIGVSYWHFPPLHPKATLAMLLHLTIYPKHPALRAIYEHHLQTLLSSTDNTHNFPSFRHFRHFTPLHVIARVGKQRKSALRSARPTANGAASVSSLRFPRFCIFVTLNCHAVLYSEIRALCGKHLVLRPHNGRRFFVSAVPFSRATGR
jgi:hypothetical protein